MGLEENKPLIEKESKLSGGCFLRKDVEDFIMRLKKEWYQFEMGTSENKFCKVIDKLSGFEE